MFLTDFIGVIQIKSWEREGKIVLGRNKMRRRRSYNDKNRVVRVEERKRRRKTDHHYQNHLLNDDSILVEAQEIALKKYRRPNRDDSMK